MSWFKKSKVEKQISGLRDLKIPEFDDHPTADGYDDYADKFLREFRKIINHPISITQVVKNDPGKSFVFYRARKYEGFKNLNLFTEYNYPPLEYCKTIQRANLPYNPVFYASNHALTTVAEILQNGFKKGDKICVSRWLMEDTLEFRITPFLFHGLNNEHPWYSKVEEIRRTGIREANPNAKEDEIAGIESLLKAISKEFLKSKDYKLSASIAHAHLYPGRSNEYTDMMLYPSVRSDGRSVNFAIHPNFVDNRVFLKEIYVMEIGEYCKLTSYIKHRLIFYGVVKGSYINWVPFNKTNSETDRVLKLYHERFK